MPRPLFPTARLLACLLTPVLLPTPSKAAEFVEPFLLHEHEGSDRTAAAIAPASFQPASASSRVRRIADQFRSLGKNEAWQEALELLEELYEAAPTDVAEIEMDADQPSAVQQPERRQRYLPVSLWPARLHSAMSEEGLAIFEQRVEQTARRQLDKAVQTLDERDLERIAYEFLGVSGAIDALLAASELAMQRGDHAAARRSLNRLHPLTRDSYGRPAGITLATIDPNVDANVLATAWRAAQRPADLLVAPPDETILPTALARLALVSIREGDLRRAEGEIRLLRALAPEATGRIAGRDQPLAEALEALRQQKQSVEPNLPKESVLEWAWNTPLLTPAPAENVDARLIAAMQRRVFGARVPAIRTPSNPQSNDPAPTVIPAVIKDHAFYVQGGVLRRVDIVTGSAENLPTPAIQSDTTSTTTQNIRPVIQPNAGRAVIQINGRQVIRVTPNGLIQEAAGMPAVRFEQVFATDDGSLYARLSRLTPRSRAQRFALSQNQSLVLIRPQQIDAEPPRYLPPEPAAEGGVPPHFVGAPVTRGNRIFAALANLEARRGLFIACYSKTSRQIQWTTAIGSGSSTTWGVAGGPVNAQLLLAGDSLYVATEMGAVAALDAPTGGMRWLATYPRATPTNNNARTSPGSVVVVGDRLLAAPSDSSHLLAWDAGTGRPLWEAPLPEQGRLVGVQTTSQGPTVVVAGRQVAGFDALTGQQRYLWPESPRSGIRGIGVATLYGGELFWPTRDAIYGLDPATGALTRSPIDLTPLGGSGANLVPTDHGLLVCTQKQMRLLAAIPTESEPAEPISRLIEASPTRLVQKDRPGDPIPLQTTP